MVTMEAAAAYFRIVRLNMRDVSPIIKSFGNIGFSIGEGFLNVLGEDNMTPNIEEQELIILHFWHFGENVDKRNIRSKIRISKSLPKMASSQCFFFYRILSYN